MAKRRNGAAYDAIDNFYNDLPSFVDIFDEETFYLFALGFTCCTVMLAFMLSRFVTLKEAY